MIGTFETFFAFFVNVTSMSGNLPLEKKVGLHEASDIGRETREG